MEPLQAIHVDLIGPFPVESDAGSRYILTVVDEATRFSAAHALPSKGDAADALMRTIVLWERQTGHKVKRVRLDGGGEFGSTAFLGELQARGIIYDPTAPYSPESNGLSERHNRTLVERMRCLMAHAQVPAELWEEAMSVANELKNMSPASGLPMVPYEAFLGKRPDVSRLRTFGCVAHIHVPKEKRGKLDARSVMGVHLWTNPWSRISTCLVDGRVVRPREVVSVP